MAKPDRNKRPKAAAQPERGGVKRPKSFGPSSDAAGHPRLSLKYADNEFCGDWTSQEHARDVLCFMHQFCKSTWSELRTQATGTRIRRPRYHSHEFHEVAPEARNRIVHLGHDGIFERLVRYRTKGVVRARASR